MVDRLQDLDPADLKRILGETIVPGDLRRRPAGAEKEFPEFVESALDPPQAFTQRGFDPANPVPEFPDPRIHPVHPIPQTGFHLGNVAA